MKAGTTHIELFEPKSIEEKKLQEIQKLLTLCQKIKKDNSPELKKLQNALKTWESSSPDLNYQLAQTLWRYSAVPHLVKILNEKAELLCMDAAAFGSLDAMLEMAHRAPDDEQAIAWYWAAIKKAPKTVINILDRIIEESTLTDFLEKLSNRLIEVTKKMKEWTETQQENLQDDEKNNWIYYSEQCNFSALKGYATAFRFTDLTKDRPLRKIISKKIKSCNDEGLLKKLISIYLIKDINYFRTTKKETTKFIDDAKLCFEQIKSNIKLDIFTDTMVNLYQVAIVSTKENENIALLFGKLFDKFQYDLENKEQTQLNNWLKTKEIFSKLKEIAFAGKVSPFQRIKPLLLLSRLYTDYTDENYQSIITELLQLNDEGVLKKYENPSVKQAVFRLLAAYYAERKGFESKAMSFYIKALEVNQDAPDLIAECDKFEQSLTERIAELKKKDTLLTAFTDIFESSPGKKLEEDLAVFRQDREELRDFAELERLAKTKIVRFESLKK